MRGMTKNQYQQCIAEYLIRRKKVWEANPTLPHSPVVRARLSKMGLKIKRWRQALRIIERHEKTLSFLDESVEEYFGFGVRGSVDNDAPSFRNARSVFCKTALESRVPPKYIALYLGYSRSNVATDRRKKFTKSFSYRPEMLSLWHSFHQFIQQRKYQEAAA